ncbi:MAG: transcription-repair coupling factor [Bacteroidaceae bacterium]|nr:transcription-repair coupling factor [Bacteroidaceae bacterium]
MNVQQLLRVLAAHPQVRLLGETLRRSRPRSFQVEGLQGSAVAAMFAALSSSRARLPLLLFVLDDNEEAGYFYHDLMQLTGSSRVLFFPSSYRRAIKYNQRDGANEILRTEVLSQLTNASDGEIFAIVTYPDALAESVVSRQQMSGSTIAIRVGMTVDFAELEQQMDSLGFQRVDYVYEPGQYAMRGSIVDVYSYSSEEPFRIDFFGDEVESIRTFDVQTQLSDHTVTDVSIVAAMSQQNCLHVPVFDFLPKDTVVVTRDRAYVCDRVAQVFREGFSQQATHEGNEATDFQQKVVQPDMFNVAFATFRCALLSSGESNVRFNTSPQPPFHKNFELVEQECRRLTDEGYTLYILADSTKQLDRLREIFASFAVPLSFIPIEHTLHAGFIDHDLKAAFLTDHQIFDRFHKFNLKSERVRRGRVALTLKELQQFSIGDYVVHIDHGIGRFGGLVNVPSDTGRGYQEMIKITYQREDTVYVSIHALHKISKYKGKEGETPRLSHLGTGAWERMKDRVKAKVKDIARDLIRLYAQRMKEQGFSYSKDSYLQHELEASFIYEDTPDQLKATQDVKADMERPQPMDRLVCGDVGFGKTEVAVRAAFKAAVDGKQTAVLVPTTVLAYQHYQTFTSRLKDLPVRVDYLSRARSAAEQKVLLQDLADGKIDIIIGTHKLIGKTVKFHDLGLLIIDEEQKFGVGVKEKLRQMKVNVDTLTLTATPIPRTLQFSLMGARDLSVIQTPPPNRYPIQTEIHAFSTDVIAEAINFEMSRNGQVFFVNNRINNLPELEAMIHRAVPDARVCVGHGRMDPKELERVVMGFMNYDYDVMLSTTIVENGVDVPNANTIIINSAQNYGLSDLHQMRGRVGRSNKKAFCYLLAPPLGSLPDDARRRLRAIENFSDLGSGLHIAMQDLDIRGAGNMLGAEQSGFIADLGYETYQKVLAEAMQELRQTHPLAPPKGGERLDHPDGHSTSSPWGGLGEGSWDTSIESDLAAYFSESFVPSSSERMNLYRELDNLTSENALKAYRQRLIDRFGTPPFEAEELLRVMPLKWAASRLGIERITLKQRRMSCFFPADKESLYYQSDAFGRVIHYASWHPRGCKLRDDKLRSLLIYDVQTVEQALGVLQEMLKDNK